MCGGSNSVPPPPPPSAQELALQDKQVQALDYYTQSLKKQDAQNAQLQNVYNISTGLYTPTYDANGALTGTTLDPNAVATLRGNASKNADISKLELDNYEKALKGELPVSEGTTQREAQQFKLLKETLSAKGSDISGETLDTAAATDSAGIENLGRLRSNVALEQDAERRGMISQFQGIQAGSGPLSLASDGNNYGPAATAAGYGQVSNAYGAAQQPYQYQQGLVYQSGLQTSANKAQRQAGISNLIGVGAGAAATAAAIY